jgi:hypothetical protein
MDDHHFSCITKLKKIKIKINPAGCEGPASL